MKQVSTEFKGMQKIGLGEFNGGVRNRTDMRQMLSNFQKTECESLEFYGVLSYKVPDYNNCIIVIMLLLNFFS